MRAAAFIRYHSGQGFGHVAWGFDFGTRRVNAGSVENHSGHIFSPSDDMGFWTAFCDDPVGRMRSLQYDDVKILDVPNADPVLAYRVVLWIRTMKYAAAFRNCEDDVYDVLRAFGVTDLTPPSLVWFPKSWFRRFRGDLAHLEAFEWSPTQSDSNCELPAPQDIEPWQPTWRRPWHPDFHWLNLARLFHKPTN